MTTQNSLTSRLAGLSVSVYRAVLAPVIGWYNRQRMYEELNGLSDRVLSDIGITRAQIPTLVKQAYRKAPATDLPAAAVVRQAQPLPAASNDSAKQQLAA